MYASTAITETLSGQRRQVINATLAALEEESSAPSFPTVSKEQQTAAVRALERETAAALAAAEAAEAEAGKRTRDRQQERQGEEGGRTEARHRPTTSRRNRRRAEAIAREQSEYERTHHGISGSDSYGGDDGDEHDDDDGTGEGVVKYIYGCVYN